MALDADIKELYESEDATIGNKAQLLNLQANRDFQSATLAIGSQDAFDNDFKRSLYVSCFERACDLRRQQMSTTTTEKTEDDIIGDIDRIAMRLYNNAKAKIAAL